MGTLMDVPMPFYQLEGSLGEPPYNLRMESQNFQHILSWQAKTDPAVPATYNVLYKDYRDSAWTTARHCSGIAQLSCDLTEDFQDTSAVYLALVQSIIGTKKFNSSQLHFMPFYQTYLGPPEVDMTPCLNCINVTIKMPTSHFREKGKQLSLIDIYKELYYEITLKSQDKEPLHKRPREKTTQEVFSTVLEELYPNRNYCVSVVVTASMNRHSIPSAWKCVPSDTAARPGYQAAAVAGAVCVSLIIAAALKCMHAGGYFLQNKSLPHALELIRRWVYSSWILEPEEVDCVEVLHAELTAQALGGGDSDSDNEDSEDSSALWHHDYTRREVLGRAPRAPDTPPVPYSVNSPGEDSDSDSQDSASPAPAPQGPEKLGTPPGTHQDTGTELLSPFPEGNCHYPGRQSSSSGCFTINLQSVLLGTLEGSGDRPGPAPPPQEEEGDWQCAHALEAQEDMGAVQKALCGGDFQEWQNSPLEEEESDSSESDMDQITGYMRR